MRLSKEKIPARCAYLPGASILSRNKKGGRGFPQYSKPDPTSWGTLRILLEGKSHGLIENVKPQLNLLEDGGMWVSEGIRQRLLALAGEK